MAEFYRPWTIVSADNNESWVLHSESCRCVTAIQGHSRSLKLVLIESPCATSY